MEKHRHARIGKALNSSREPVTILDAYNNRQNGIEEDYYCRECNGKLKAVIPRTDRVAHFSHYSPAPSDCKASTGYETPWHSKNKLSFPKYCREVTIRNDEQYFISDVLTPINSAIEFQSKANYTRVIKGDIKYRNAGVMTAWQFDLTKREDSLEIEDPKDVYDQIAMRNADYDYDKILKNPLIRAYKLGGKPRRAYYLPHNWVFIDLGLYLMRVNIDKVPTEGYMDGEYFIPDYSDSYFLGQLLSWGTYYNYYISFWRDDLKKSYEYAQRIEKRVASSYSVNKKKAKKMRFGMVTGRFRRSEPTFPDAFFSSCDEYEPKTLISVEELDKQDLADSIQAKKDVSDIIRKADEVDPVFPTGPEALIEGDDLKTEYDNLTKNIPKHISFKDQQKHGSTIDGRKTGIEALIEKRNREVEDRLGDAGFPPSKISYLRDLWETLKQKYELKPWISWRQWDKEFRQVDAEQSGFNQEETPLTELFKQEHEETKAEKTKPPLQEEQKDSDEVTPQYFSNPRIIIPENSQRLESLKSSIKAEFKENNKLEEGPYILSFNNSHIAKTTWDGWAIEKFEDWYVKLSAEDKSRAEAIWRRILKTKKGVSIWHSFRGAYESETGISVPYE
ncbi:MAG: hypothetical protein AAF696_32070 [Bacteroidota bacterium]